MKHQQVSVDYWSMGKAMLVYGGLTILCWIMLRLFNTVFTLPRRLRAQHENIQDTLKELQRRFPDMNITEEDLKEAEKELDEYIKEDQQKKEENETGETPQIEDKKSL
ncbi:uncharacterized protein LOC128671240 [Plodia interpunctella]|uniref:uncharacterized protein LOC128671240 n=1 Tax=Plodia interpunctella TaxID=58824 RepID=UPI002367D496|nr:uncharacterized protein LOC128671240 [Plodia interpunctella]